MALKDFIVAIELGSSKIRGIAGKKNTDGSIQVLALAEEDATECIRKGMVYNIDKTSTCLQSIIKKLKSTLHTDISQVYVGVGGQSILSVKNVIMKQLPDEEIITGDMINEIMDNNRSMIYPDKQILDAVTLEYKVGTQRTIDPVGIPAKSIEGNFLNILQRKSLYNNLEKCFDKAGINVAEYYLAPIALADSVLKDEKRLGCVLVDLGADTTTVSVYYRNIMRHLAVIPLGGSNITKDLTTLKMEENEAEKMKLKYGSAYTDPELVGEDYKDETYVMDGDTRVSAEEFNNIVEDRMLEIIKNAWSQIPEGIVSKVSIGGIILTGGGSRLKNVKQAFIRETKVAKVRIATDTTLTITGNIPELNNNNGVYNTLLGLLNKGDMNCAGTAQPDRSLFDNEGANQPRPAVTGTGGVRQTLAEQQRIEQEKIRKEREEQRIREEAAEAERLRLEELRAAEERKQQEKSGIKKLFDGAKKFFTKLVSEGEEEK